MFQERNFFVILLGRHKVKRSGRSIVITLLCVSSVRRHSSHRDLKPPRYYIHSHLIHNWSCFTLLLHHHVMSLEFPDPKFRPLNFTAHLPDPQCSETTLPYRTQLHCLKVQIKIHHLCFNRLPHIPAYN